MSRHIIVILCFFVSLQVYAQFVGVPKDPYSGSVPDLIHVGTMKQVKIGDKAILGITLFSKDLNWLSGFDAQVTPALVVDSPVRIQKYGSGDVNNSTDFETLFFGLDTISPISVNGVWSRAPIVTSDSLSAVSLGYQLTNKDSSRKEIALCSDSGGVLVPCEQRSPPAISLSVTPRTILSDAPEPVNLQWSSVGARECHAISGKGFYTDKQIAGSDESNIIRGDSGGSVIFTIACTDEVGMIGFKSVEVSVQ